MEGHAHGQLELAEQETRAEPKTTRAEQAELKNTATEQMGPKMITIEQMTTTM